MPYPPESPWNLPPTDGQVQAIERAGKILHLDITEKDIPDSRWRARDLQMDLWERVRSKGKRQKAGCVVLKEHDDGDLTMECNERRYVVTTEGEVFGEDIICECP